MSVSYSSVLWNRQKKRYDIILIVLVLLYLIGFIVLNAMVNPEITEETLLIRSTGTLAITMLHVILAIGPLSRLNPKFLPLLYNRRHLGVTMFVIASIHGVFSILQFHSLSDTIPLVSVFISNLEYNSLVNFPFQVLGFFGLMILFFMAATSHDFWLNNLSPRIWKSLHMLVYLAYVLLVLHIMLGAAQNESSPILIFMLALGMIFLIGVHIMAGNQEKTFDRATSFDTNENFTLVCEAGEIPENRARIVNFGDERIAIFKYDGKLSAVSNVCCHQNGPLGEGKIIDGLITCPWHGYQYQPHDGCAPAPFTEKVATYDLKVENGKVLINPKAHPPGTEITPVQI